MVVVVAVVVVVVVYTSISHHKIVDSEAVAAEPGEIGEL